MSGFTCPNCGHVTSIFGHDGVSKIAHEMELDILGDIPLHLSIRETSDAGTPVVVAHPDTAQVKCCTEDSWKDFMIKQDNLHTEWHFNKFFFFFF